MYRSLFTWHRSAIAGTAACSATTTPGTACTSTTTTSVFVSARLDDYGLSLEFNAIKSRDSCLGHFNGL